MLPVRNNCGALVNVTWRPERGRTMRWRGEDVDRPKRVPGRRVENGGLPLWPRVPSGSAWLLVAGEWDALAAIEVGLPAVTGLLGCHWAPGWNEHVPGRRIAVLFDVGEQFHAIQTKNTLLGAGAAAAWIVDPARLGLTAHGADLCDYFVGGGTAAKLVRVIKAGRHVH